MSIPANGVRGKYAAARLLKPSPFMPSESLLERITRKLRDGWKRLIDILNQPGVPKNGSNTYGYPD